MLPTLQPLPDASALGAIVLAVLGVASEARPAAAAECSIALGGAPVEGWTLAVRELERSGSVPADCALVAIEASGERARLVFQTRDGRRAERGLDHPDELVPALRALGVGAKGDGAPSLPAPDIPSAPAVATPAVAAPAAFGGDAAASSSPEPAPGHEARAIFALLGGMRGGVGNLLSPALGGSAAIELDRWELGVNLVLELQYFDLGGGEPPSAAACVGVTVGRREPVADFDVLYGARTMIAAFNDESEVDQGERGRAEVRLGTYLGGAWPRAGSLRWRADLAVDVVPHRALGSAGTRIAPWLGASVLVGAEFNGP
jgi:hypothetical protein